MNTYHVIVNTYDKRKDATDGSAWKHQQTTLQATNERHAAAEALSRIGYGEIRQKMTRNTCMGCYAAEYRDLATFYMYPMKVEGRL